MFGIGGPELAVILIIALIFVGPEKLPKVARSLGTGLRDLRRAANVAQAEFQRTVDDLVREADLSDELRREPRAVEGGATPKKEALTAPTHSKSQRDATRDAITAEARARKPDPGIHFDDDDDDDDDDEGQDAGEGLTERPGAAAQASTTNRAATTSSEGPLAWERVYATAPYAAVGDRASIETSHDVSLAPAPAPIEQEQDLGRAMLEAHRSRAAGTRARAAAPTRVASAAPIQTSDSQIGDSQNGDSQNGDSQNGDGRRTEESGPQGAADSGDGDGEDTVDSGGSGDTGARDS